MIGGQRFVKAEQTLTILSTIGHFLAIYSLPERDKNQLEEFLAILYTCDVRAQ